MPKSIRPAPPREANALSRLPREEGQLLLDRILDVPHLAQVVPRLQPEVLHRIVERCGLEDCGPLVSLATPDQLMRVFDLDLWHSDGPGLDEALDGRRFGVWLEVLVEAGVAVAAQKLVGLDLDLVIAGFAQHVLVMDLGSVSTFRHTDGQLVTPRQLSGSGPVAEIGGYVVEAKRPDAWDAIAAVLEFLGTEHREYFHRLMAGCRRLSNSAPEEDGFHDLLTDTAQDMFDVAVDREGRQEKQGYVMPAQARAFLQMARQVQFTDHAPPPNAVADAYFRAVEWTPSSDTAATPDSVASSDSAEALAAVVDVLVDAGVITQQPRALLEAPHEDEPRGTRIEAQMRFAHDRDGYAYSRRMEEFAFLTNTMVAGCSVQSRPFTVREASDATAAICNLGLENWPPARAALPDGFLVQHDLIGVFQVGWSVLYRDVVMYAAKRLIDVLCDLRQDDDEVRAGLEALRVSLERHCRDGAPWCARDALEVIMLLDMPAWAALLGLIDEFPVIHAAIGTTPGSRTISATAFEFIAENRQIASVRDFLDSLATTLGG